MEFEFELQQPPGIDREPASDSGNLFYFLASSLEGQPRARLSLVRGDPEGGGDDDQDELDPPLNHQRAEDIDRIVGPPSGKDKRAASGSASAASTRAITHSREDFILQQNAQQE